MTSRRPSDLVSKSVTMHTYKKYKRLSELVSKLGQCTHTRHTGDLPSWVTVCTYNEYKIPSELVNNLGAHTIMSGFDEIRDLGHSTDMYTDDLQKK